MVNTIVSPLSATSADLYAMAIELARRDQNPWPIVATVLGRIDDERLYRTEDYGGYNTARAWALDVLNLPPVDFHVYVDKLWPMVRRYPEITLDRWAKIPKGRALLLVKVLAIPGGDVARWLDAAEKALSTSALESTIAGALPEPEWITWSVRIPVTLLGNVNEAMRVAGRRVLQVDEPELDRINERDVKFRCFEIMVEIYRTYAHLDVEAPA